MTDTFVIQVTREALVMVLILSVPILLAGLLVGLVIGILQATTQIQEQSLTFVPKLIVTIVVMVLLAPWLIKVMVGYTGELFAKLPSVIR
ncbi:flagellar biosynthesis protein FliQ [Desulfocucumis palustris]|uniref:Flagellar biosynthetic protein FliQ n=1 Tax=Desulfocucumis palustris TaxID=1898651 RepID=A0A2L2XH42_9FIRM|nr:flagellar biosynthesis protein FliQ [Desulfocucumis palustris]GBF33201.1 flagellar biosynthesis protein FliQ [Desulfocucumis palustris]